MKPHDQELTPEEFQKLLERAMSEEDEIENARALIRWFRTRYPDPASRLAYARRTYRAWTQPARLLPR